MTSKEPILSQEILKQNEELIKRLEAQKKQIQILIENTNKILYENRIQKTTELGQAR